MANQTDNAPPRRHTPRRILSVLLWSLVTLIAVSTIIVLYLWITWPDVERLAHERPRTTAFIDAFRHDADGDTTALRWSWIDWNRISPNVKAAVLVAEDIEFFSHGGFSLSEIRAAIRQAVASGASLRGASTLTQQLAKNLWLSPSRNPLRKAKEALLTLHLERALSKERVFELYLNVAEFGRGIYGVEAASQYYFAKSAETLTIAEAAQLAASLSRPSRWNPHSSSTAYVARAARIRDLMAQHGDYLERLVGFQPEQLASTPLEHDIPN